MCDTLVALARNTADAVTLFAKNSDRQRNESQVVERFPAVDYAAGSRLKCTFIEIPQARRTHPVLLCRPFWIWGAEMGANDQGVVIGNEGLLSRAPPPREEALTGMDLVRIGLERASTAAEAVEILSKLLGEYGQGGNCGHLVPNYYNNGFLIADPQEAFVMETVGREWITEKVHDLRSISNGYSVGAAAAGSSQGLPDLLRQLSPTPVAPNDIPDLLADPRAEHLGQADSRRTRSAQLLRTAEGRLNSAALMQILRDHGPDESWTPRSPLGRTICMHAESENRQGQTTGSIVCELHRHRQVHWVTGTAAPCVSIFKPVMVDVPIPPHGSRPTDRYDGDSLWWNHEVLHRSALARDLPRFVKDIAAERDNLELKFHDRMASVRENGNVEERYAVIASCWEEATDAEARWLKQLHEQPPINAADAYAATWSKMNALAGMEGAL